MEHVEVEPEVVQAREEWAAICAAKRAEVTARLKDALKPIDVSAVVRLSKQSSSSTTLDIFGIGAGNNWLAKEVKP